MTSATSPFLLPLRLPNSPLLSGSLTDDFAATLIAQGICNPLPALSFAPASPRPRTTKPKALPPQCKPILQDKPLPSVPVPPRQIISLLDLLERMDEDVTKEVQRVRENVKEARAAVREFREEREKRLVGAKQRKENERRETKGLDDDFWLNA